MQTEEAASRPDAPHPNGPRTFATFMRDGAPISIAAAHRLIALDRTHPTLTDLRYALGMDLQLSDWSGPARSGWPLGREPSDEDLAAMLDAMYRGVSSSRMVRAQIDADGLRVSREEAPIVVREGEQLILWAFADNRRDAEVEFSVAARGEGAGGGIEAGRTRSLLLDAGPLPSGKYLLPAVVVADEQPATIDLPIECAPSGIVLVRIVDDETGEAIAARVYLKDDLGATFPEGSTFRRDMHGNVFFHADGAFEARASGRITVCVARGIEYEPLETTLDVGSEERAEVTLRLRRWSHMAADGWYSGDVHVHLHYGGEYLLTPEDAALAQRAEDVNFMNMMVANQGSDWVHDQGSFTGAPHDLSDGEHILQWGEEYRNDFYGHMCMYGIGELVPSIYSGFRQSEHADDMPPNDVAARHCHSVGGTLSYAHPMFDSGELDRMFARSRTVEAKELPIDAALGHIDAVDVMSYPGHELETSGLWYRLLNCGLRLAATAGTDTFMNMCDSGRFSNPPAGDRVFVRVEGDFNTQSWCDGVRAGRTFVTDGPMLSLTVDGHEIGDAFDAKRGDIVHVEAAAGSDASMDVLELIVNGEVVASAEATDGGRSATLSHDLRLDESRWIAARALGPSHPFVLDDTLFAHTSPIYVSVDSAPVSLPKDAGYFVEWIDRLIAMCETKGAYSSDADRASVIALFRKGQAYYRERAG